MTDAIAILKKVGAILTNSHFVYTSGRHGSVYLNKDALYPHTKETSQMGELFALFNKERDIDVVVGPAIGAIILSQWTAYHLSRLKNKEILSVFTEKTPDKNQVFTRGYEKFVKDKNVLVVEDWTTTGQSVKKSVASVKAAGGKVVCITVMVNRDPKNVTEKELGAPIFSLGDFPLESYDENSCPLCKKGIPINTTIGHGKKFMDSKK